MARLSTLSLLLALTLLVTLAAAVSRGTRQDKDSVLLPSRQVPARRLTKREKSAAARRLTTNKHSLEPSDSPSERPNNVPSSIPTINPSFAPSDQTSDQVGGIPAKARGGSLVFPTPITDSDPVPSPYPTELDDIAIKDSNSPSGAPLVESSMPSSESSEIYSGTPSLSVLASDVFSNVPTLESSEISSLSSSVPSLESSEISSLSSSVPSLESSEISSLSSVPSIESSEISSVPSIESSELLSSSTPSEEGSSLSGQPTSAVDLDSEVPSDVPAPPPPTATPTVVPTNSPTTSPTAAPVDTTPSPVAETATESTITTTTTASAVTQTTTKTSPITTTITAAPVATTSQTTVLSTTTLPEVEAVNSSFCTADNPCPICYGDCDEDIDCQGDLVCFERDPGEPVPGCSGGEKSMSYTDYCIDPNAMNGRADMDEPAEGSGQPTTSALEMDSDIPSEAPSNKPIYHISAETLSISSPTASPKKEPVPVPQPIRGRWYYGLHDDRE